MLVRHTPRSSFDSGQTPPTAALLSLPPELREEIYTYALSAIIPATYTIYCHASATHWSSRRMQHPNTPSLLLVCRALRDDVRGFLHRTREGVVFRVNPDARLRCWSDGAVLWDKADEQDRVVGLGPVLGTARKINVEINLPQSSGTQARVLALLRWMIVVMNARPVGAEALDVVRVRLNLEDARLWPEERHYVRRVLESAVCGELDISCAWQEGDAHGWVKRCVVKRTSLALDETSETVSEDQRIKLASTVVGEIREETKGPEVAWSNKSSYERKGFGLGIMLRSLPGLRPTYV